MINLVSNKYLKYFFICLKNHMLLKSFFLFILNGFDKKGMILTKTAIRNRIYTRLKRKYEEECVKYFDELKGLPHSHSKKVFVCWFQGMDNAPDIVKNCYLSLQRHCKDREIVVITEQNYSQFVTVPSYIEEKYKKGIFSKTHFSDIIRLELLIKYGGSWIDSTCLLTGFERSRQLFDADFFYYKEIEPSSRNKVGALSSWFISSCSNNEILLGCRFLLYRYWKDYNYTVDYFLFHILFDMSIDLCPYSKYKEKMVEISNSIPHMIYFNLDKEFDDEKFKRFCDQSDIHKLTYKYDSVISNSFLEKILSGELL